MSQKIVINRCLGGFGLSEKALKILGIQYHSGIERNDPKLVKVVEELGKESWGRYAELKVVKIPDNVRWEIHEYDGMEYVAEKHRTWK